MMTMEKKPVALEVHFHFVKVFFLFKSAKM